MLEGRRRVLGQHHTATIHAMISLAQTLQAQGHKKEASSLLAEALAISSRVLGKKHTVTTGAAWRLAQTFEPGRRKAFIMLNPSWLGSAPPGQLTAEQKDIKNGLKGVVHTGKRQPGGRKKKR